MPKDSVIRINRSVTGGSTPSASALAAGELAVNLTDKRLYCGDAAGTSYIELTRRADSSSATINSLRVQLADTAGGLTGNSLLTFDPTLGQVGGCTGNFGSMTLYSSGANRTISGDGASNRTVSIVQASGGDVALGDAILNNNSGVGVKVSESTFSTTVYGDLYLEPDPLANTLGAVNAMGGFYLVPDLIGAISADLRFYEAAANGSNYVGFKAPSIIAANKIWTLPSADGTNGQVLSTNGSGTLSWATAGGGSGTVTSITPAADSGSGTAITTSGTITISGTADETTTSVSGTTVTVGVTDGISTGAVGGILSLFSQGII